MSATDLHAMPDVLDLVALCGCSAHVDADSCGRAIEMGGMFDAV